MMNARTVTGAGLIALAIGLVVNSVLGPLWLDVIEYRFSESLINQGIGLDFVSLVLVAPTALIAGILILRERSRGYLLALGPAAYAAYMSVQYSIGPEYLNLNGNNEQFLLLHLALFIVSVVSLTLTWSGLAAGSERELSSRWRRTFGVVLLVAGALLILRYTPTLAEAVAGDPQFSEYRENATSYFLITWMDLGLFMPLSLATGIGLLRSSAWALNAAYGLINWFALTGTAVAAMAVVMQIRDDPDASVGAVIGFVIVAAISLGLWAALHVKMFAGPRSVSSEQPRESLSEVPPTTASPLPR